MANDLAFYSKLFGTAVSNQGSALHTADVANSFLTTPKIATQSWDRAVMVSSGTFPSGWLAKAARHNALDTFAANGAGGFNGMGYRGEPNSPRRGSATSAPGMETRPSQSRPPAASTPPLGCRPSRPRNSCTPWSATWTRPRPLQRPWCRVPSGHGGRGQVGRVQPAAGESHLNDVAQAYGSVAGDDNKATTDVVGHADESAKVSSELTRNVLSAGIDLIPGEKIVEKLPGTFWDVAKHAANYELEQSYGETDDPRFDA